MNVVQIAGADACLFASLSLYNTYIYILYDICIKRSMSNIPSLELLLCFWFHSWLGLRRWSGLKWIYNSLESLDRWYSILISISINWTARGHVSFNLHSPSTCFFQWRWWSNQHPGETWTRLVKGKQKNTAGSMKIRSSKSHAYGCVT